MSSQPRVLLVDYEPRNIRSVTEMLQAAGYTVDVVHDGVAALKAFQSGHPDGVLLEAMLPKKHGFEVCKEIKSLPGGDEIPVVITTGVYRGRKYRNQALHVYGCDEYLERPFAREELLEILKRLLPHDELPAEAQAQAAAPAPAEPTAASDAAPELQPPPPAQAAPPPAVEEAAPEPFDPAEGLPSSDEFEMALSETLDGIFEDAPGAEPATSEAMSSVEKAWEAGAGEFIPVDPENAAAPAEAETPDGGSIELGELISEGEVDQLFSELSAEVSAEEPAEEPQELVTEAEVSRLFENLEAAGAAQAEPEEPAPFEVDETVREAVDLAEDSEETADALAETMIMDAASSEPAEEELPEGANRLIPSSDTEEMGKEVAAFQAETDDPHSWATEMEDEESQAESPVAEPILPSLEADAPADQAEPPAPEVALEEEAESEEIFGALAEGFGDPAPSDDDDETPAGFGLGAAEARNVEEAEAEPQAIGLEVTEETSESGGEVADELGEETWIGGEALEPVGTQETEDEIDVSPAGTPDDSAEELVGELAGEGQSPDEEASAGLSLEGQSPEGGFFEEEMAVTPGELPEDETGPEAEEQAEPVADPDEGSVGFEALAGADLPNPGSDENEPVAEDSPALMGAEELAPEDEEMEAAPEAAGEALRSGAEIVPVPETEAELEEARPVPVEVPQEEEAERGTGRSRRIWVVIAVAAALLAAAGAGVLFLGGGEWWKGAADTEPAGASRQASRQASLGAPLPSLSNTAPTTGANGGPALTPGDPGEQAQAAPTAGPEVTTQAPREPATAAAPVQRPAPTPEPSPKKSSAGRAAAAPAPARPEPAVAEDPPIQRAAMSLEAEPLPEEREPPSGAAADPEDAPMAGLAELPSLPLVEQTKPVAVSPEEVEVVDTSAPKARRGEVVEFAKLDLPPRAVVTTQPEFPRFAVMQGLRGKVFVNVLVAEDGTVADARAVTGPHKILNRAAVDAIKSWRYTPPVKDGVQVRTWKTEIILFK